MRALVGHLPFSEHLLGLFPPLLRQRGGQEAGDSDQIILARTVLWALWDKNEQSSELLH